MMGERLGFSLRLIVLLGALLAPAAILSLGYQPGDDGLRHVAKVFSGKTWRDLLVTDNPYNLEVTHIGWHTLLDGVRRTGDFTPDGLLVLAIYVLAAGFLATPLFFVARAESWAAVLFILALFHSDIGRLMLGRPFIVSEISLMVVLFSFARLNSGATAGRIALCSVAIGFAVWIHTNWYLFVVPLAGLVLSRRWRGVTMVGVTIALGIAIGSCLTGHPVVFLKDTFLFNFYSLPPTLDVTQLVAEFQPFDGDIFMVLAMAVFLLFVREKQSFEKLVDDPAFLLALSCWLLGFKVGRFWFDWGIPAAAVWMCGRLDEAFVSLTRPVYRVGLTLFFTAGFFLSITHNRHARWTNNLQIVTLSAEDPAHKGWMPQDGGILYTNTTTIVHRAFFENPRANWRYVPGYEQTLMLPEDLAVYADIKRTRSALEAFVPWAKKMKNEDRLILYGVRGIGRGALGLEWRDFVSYSIGRKPR
jgi:hypothetical protein